MNLLDFIALIPILLGIGGIICIIFISLFKTKRSVEPKVVEVDKTKVVKKSKFFGKVEKIRGKYIKDKIIETYKDPPFDASKAKCWTIMPSTNEKDYRDIDRFIFAYWLTENGNWIKEAYYLEDKISWYKVYQFDWEFYRWVVRNVPDWKNDPDLSKIILKFKKKRLL